MAAACVLALSPLAARLAGAASALRVPPIEDYGEVEAATWNEDGEQVGPASMRLERLADGRVRVEATSGFAKAPRTVVSAVLEPTPDGRALRPVSQESRSVDAEGRPLGVMAIDHERRIGTCTPPDGGEPDRVELPEDDRVANVVLVHLLQPLAEEGRGAFDFDLLACRPKARLYPAKAHVTEAPGDGPGAEDLVEIETDVDLGPVLGRVLGPFLPRVSLWFDRARAGAWVGQRMPLFSAGPTVLVLRKGLSPERISAP